MELTIRNDLRIISEDGNIDETWFTLQCTNFYANCYNNLGKWTEQFQNTSNFKWAKQNSLVTWANVLTTFEYISQNFPNTETTQSISECDLFDEVTYLKNYATIEKTKDWNEKSVDTESRWVEIFNHFKNEDIPHSIIKKNCRIRIMFTWHKWRDRTNLFTSKQFVDIGEDTIKRRNG